MTPHDQAFWIVVNFYNLLCTLPNLLCTMGEVAALRMLPGRFGFGASCEADDALVQLAVAGGVLGTVQALSSVVALWTRKAELRKAGQLLPTAPSLNVCATTTVMRNIFFQLATSLVAGGLSRAIRTSAASL